MHVDVGTGDARGPYRWAALRPQCLFVGLDANPDPMRAVAVKAARKPARGGRPNLLLLSERAESLPGPLRGLADKVTVILPWAGLLSGIAAGDASVLVPLRGLCKPGAQLTCVLSVADRDGLGLAEPDPRALSWRFAAAGLSLTTIERHSERSLRAWSTSWAKRLAFGSPRPVWRIDATAADA